jgi:hypothetical protein
VTRRNRDSDSYFEELRKKKKLTPDAVEEEYQNGYESRE